MRRLKLISWIALYLLMVYKHLGEVKDMATELWRDYRSEECITINDKESEVNMKTEVMVTVANHKNNGCEQNESRRH